MKSRISEVRDLLEGEQELARKHFLAIRENRQDEAAKLKTDLETHQRDTRRRLAMLLDALGTDSDRKEAHDLRKRTRVRVDELLLEAADIEAERKSRADFLAEHKQKTAERRRARLQAELEADAELEEVD